MPLTGGLIPIAPSSIAHTGSSATINSDNSVSFVATGRIDVRGVFSSTYDNYMVRWSATQNSSSSAIEFNLSSGTTVDYQNSYNRQAVWVYGTTVQGSRATGTSAGRIGQAEASMAHGSQVFVYGPALIQPTAFRSISYAGYQNATMEDCANIYTQTISFDGFRIAVLGTMTGTLTVFGFLQ